MIFSYGLQQSFNYNFLKYLTDMAPVGRAAVAPPQMRPPMMGGPPAGMMQGNCYFSIQNESLCFDFSLPTDLWKIHIHFSSFSL